MSFDFLNCLLLSANDLFKQMGVSMGVSNYAVSYLKTLQIGNVMKLTETIIRSLPTPVKPRKIFDGGGLYLYLTPSGRYWRYRYRFWGKERTLALGVYPEINLKTARNAHMQAKLLLASGIDPVLDKKRLKDEKRAKYGNTFADIAREWYELKRPEWKNPKHAQQVINTLETYAFPHIGHIPVASILPLMVFDVLKAVSNKPETANRVKQRISAVFEHAVLTGRATHNPALSMPKIAKKQVEHHAALPQELIPDFFERLAEYPNRMTQLALRLLILTFVRVGELRQGEWSELQGNEWHIPAEKMKMKRPHIVPLSDWALETLEELKSMNKSANWIIVGNRNRMMSDNTLAIAMKRMGYKDIAVPHGFRAMASSILNESGLWNPDAIERQLAHKEANKIRAAYNRAEYLDERHRMMQWYADYIKERLKK